MSNLLPCPFCGGATAYVFRSRYVFCEECDTCGPGVANSDEEAIAAWNRRHAPAPSNTQQAANAVIAAQEAKGLGKYGTTLDNAGLSEIEIAEHAQQEAADLLMYLTARVEMMKKGATNG